MVGRFNKSTRLANLMKNLRFPRSLRKRVRRDETGYIKGIKGFSYYPADEERQQRLRRRRLFYKQHRALPQPETQNNDWTCLVHAAVASLEARLRISRWRIDHEDMLPRLSVQHAIDAAAPFRNWDAEDVEYVAKFQDWDTVYNILGVPNYVPNLFGFTVDQIGITTAAIWPYRPENVDADLPLPNAVQDWPKFRMRDVIRYPEGEYMGTNENFIRFLIDCLKRDGPFVGWYTMRDSHNPREVMTLRGEVILDEKKEPFIHSVVISGYKIWHYPSGRMGGYWEILNDFGLGWGRNGFGRIAFDAMDGVELPLV